MKIVPLSKRDGVTMVVATVLTVSSVILAAIIWPLVFTGAENMLLLVVVAIIPTVIALMSSMTLVTGKPWYLEMVITAALLHV